jgi:DNA-binding NarL/FixJ family response regulator
MTGNRYDILVAEDEAIIALELKRLLLRNNFNVVAVVKSGEDLIKESQKQQPDVIITDINLKGRLNGIEAAKMINKKSPQTSVIFVTGCGDEYTHTKAMDAFPKAYFLKPFNEMALINSVKDCVNSNYN